MASKNTISNSQPVYPLSAFVADLAEAVAILVFLAGLAAVASAAGA